MTFTEFVTTILWETLVTLMIAKWAVGHDVCVAQSDGTKRCVVFEIRK